MRAGSAEESAQLQGIPLSALLRTIVVRRGEDDYFFVLVPAGRRFDWPKLRAHLGVRRLTLPDAEGRFMSLLLISEGISYNIFDVITNNSANTVLQETPDAEGKATRANDSI